MYNFFVFFVIFSFSSFSMEKPNTEGDKHVDIFPKAEKPINSPIAKIGIYPDGTIKAESEGKSTNLIPRTLPPSSGFNASGGSLSSPGSCPVS